jgi:predicted MPP superfamily phosphohydrolase
MDGIYDHGKRLTQMIKNLHYDLCVLTGDYRFLTYGQVHDAMVYTKRVIDVLDKNVPIVGILGNHDSIEMVPFLEEYGVRMLINESMTVQKGQDTIGIAGVDDAHFYETENLKEALKGITGSSFKILLAHSQELIPEAEKHGVDFYLCGHTHGGQICLPGGFAAIKNTPYGSRYFKGAWKHNTMEGYTSRGVGASCLPVRFNCPPEITLHTLVKAI